MQVDDVADVETTKWTETDVISNTAGPAWPHHCGELFGCCHPVSCYCKARIIQLPLCSLPNNIFVFVFFSHNK